MIIRLSLVTLLAVLAAVQQVECFQNSPAPPLISRSHYYRSCDNNRNRRNDNNIGPAPSCWDDSTQQQQLRHVAGVRSSSNTALSMGLRSMLGLGKKKKNKKGGGDSRGNKDDDGGGGGEDDQESMISLEASAEKRARPSAVRSSIPTSRSSPLPVTAPPLRMGEDPVSKEVNVHAIDQNESVQERINRVKSGKMTEFEKQSFLQTALTAGNTAESRKPLLDGKSDKDSDGNKKRRFFASPFPSDSILRNFASGGNVDGQDEELSTQKKKQEYFDMVTNPERFNRYRHLSKDGDGDDGEKIDNNNRVDPMPSDLGARLGAAALANENIRQEQKQQIELQQERRQQYEVRAEQLARQRTAEVQQLEVRQADRRKELDLKRQQEEQMKSREQQQRLEELTRAQEEYWNKKLSAEKKARAERLAKQADEEGGGKKKKKKKSGDDAVAAVVADTEVDDSSTAIDAADAAKTDDGDGTFNPDESNLLEEAEHDKENTWEHNQDIIDRSSSRVTGIPPSPPPHETESDFLAEQARRKAEIDRQREMQLQRLKEFNSPLPNPVMQPHASVSKATTPGAAAAAAAAAARQPPPAAYTANSRAASPPPAVVPRSGAASVTGGVVPDVSNNNQTPSSNPAETKSASLFSRPDSAPTRRKDASSSEGQTAVAAQSSPPPTQQPEPESVVPEPAPPANDSPPATKKSKSSGGWPFGGLNIGNKSSNDNKKDEVKKPTPQQNTKDVSSSPPPPAKKEEPPRKKGPIRMQLPLGDDHDEEEDGVDVSSNKKMSIADAMKKTTDSGNINQGERSKKWGVDISRFT